MDKYYVLLVSVFALCGTAVWITSEMSKPKLTDPVAQRIWAAGHPSVELPNSERALLIQKTLELEVSKVEKKDSLK